MNADNKVVEEFGKEWNKFDQSGLDGRLDLQEIFDSYFSLFPWGQLPENSVGFDLGCGSGRWAKFVAQKVGKLHCIDASPAALNVAKNNLADNKNCEFHLASVDSIPLPDASSDFGYSLGVLHHIPDTEAGIRACVSKLKPGAPFLVYLYYAFDNKPSWFKMIWKLSHFLRLLISKSPFRLKYLLCQIIAATIYYPIARLSLLIEKAGFSVQNIPLSCYRNWSFYVMRNDALDRFSTRLEKRFTQAEIKKMLVTAGLTKIKFSNKPPYWCAIGFKR